MIIDEMEQGDMPLNFNFCQKCGRPAVYDTAKQIQCSCGMYMIVEMSLLGRITYYLPISLASLVAWGDAAFSQVWAENDFKSQCWNFFMRVRPVWYFQLRALPIMKKLFGELEDLPDEKEYPC